MADDGHTTFPGGGKIAGLALLLVALVAIIVKGPWAGSSTPDAPDLALLQDLGTNSDAPLDNLERRLGGSGGDDPIDLLDLPGPTPSARPAATSSPSGLDIPGEAPSAIPVPTRTPTRAPTIAPSSSPASTLRDVDAAKLFAAYQAGDHAYLESVMRDARLETAGRALAVALASMLPEAPVDQSFYELFEGTTEPFALRETSAYALLGREGADFPRYLVRVLGRPRVRSGEDQQAGRLVLLAFAADRWVHDGQALDQVGDALIAEAREGSTVAAAALSFGLAPDRPLVEERDRLESLAKDQPAISGNLRRFYQAMVDRGRADYRPALERLGTAGL